MYAVTESRQFREDLQEESGRLPYFRHVLEQRFYPRLEMDPRTDGWYDRSLGFWHTRFDVVGPLLTVQTHYTIDDERRPGYDAGLGSRALRPRSDRRMNPFQGLEGSLEEVLLRDFAVKPFNILQAKAHLAGLRAVDLTKNRPEASVVALWTPILAWRHRAVPIAIRESRGERTLFVAVSPGCDREMIGRSLQECHEEVVILVLAMEEQIQETLSRLYGPDPDAAGLDLSRPWL